MNILVVSDREYKKTSRGIDIITTYLANNGHYVDHLVFFKRIKCTEKIISPNIRQLYFYDPVKIYRSRLQFLFPGFLLISYFNYLFRKQNTIKFDKYDYVILESGHPIYIASQIKNKIIYRQSDPTYISFNSNRSFYTKLETTVIKKSLFIISALDEKYFNSVYKNKYIHWHSGFIPYKNISQLKSNNDFCIIGGGLDWKLIYMLIKKYKNYKFNIIGIQENKLNRSNVSILGYLDFNEYQNIIFSSKIVIIPYTKRFANKLRQTSFTAKILFPMDLNIPIIIKNYGTIQNSDFDKKLFVYKNRKEALLLIDDIINKTESNNLSNNISNSTLNFLKQHRADNRFKELDTIFRQYLK